MSRKTKQDTEWDMDLGRSTQDPDPPATEQTPEPDPVPAAQLQAQLADPAVQAELAELERQAKRAPKVGVNAALELLDELEKRCSGGQEGFGLAEVRELRRRIESEPWFQPSVPPTGPTAA